MSGVSYSSLRQVAIQERDYFQEVQSWFVEEFMQRIYQRWLIHVMDFGFIGLPSTKFDKFASASQFRCRGWKWVDPAKEVMAVESALHNGLMSMTEASDQLGYDLDETWQQISREKQLAGDLSIGLSFEPFGLKPGQKNEQDEEAQENGEG